MMRTLRSAWKAFCMAPPPKEPIWSKPESPKTVIDLADVGLASLSIDTSNEARILNGYRQLTATRVFDARFERGVGREELGIPLELMRRPAVDAWDVAVGSILLSRRVLGAVQKADVLERRLKLCACMIVACKHARLFPFRLLVDSQYANCSLAVVYSLIYPPETHLSSVESNSQLLNETLLVAEATLLAAHAHQLHACLALTPAQRVEVLAAGAMGVHHEEHATVTQQLLLAHLRNVASYVSQLLLLSRIELLLDWVETRPDEAARVLLAIAVASLDVAIGRFKVCDVFRPPASVRGAAASGSVPMARARFALRTAVRASVRHPLAASMRQDPLTSTATMLAVLTKFS